MRFCQMTGSATGALSAFRFAIRRSSLLLSLRQRLSCCTLRLFQNATNPLCQPRVLQVRRQLLWSRFLTQLGTSGFYPRRKFRSFNTGSAPASFPDLTTRFAATPALHGGNWRLESHRLHGSSRDGRDRSCVGKI